MAFQEYKIPRQAFDDCTAQGRVDDAVEYWEKKLNAEKPFDIASCRRTVQCTGAWSKEEIAALSDSEIRQKALWVAAGGAESSVTHRNTKNVWIYFGE